MSLFLTEVNILWKNVSVNAVIAATLAIKYYVLTLLPFNHTWNCEMWYLSLISIYLTLSHLNCTCLEVLSSWLAVCSSQWLRFEMC